MGWRADAKKAIAQYPELLQKEQRLRSMNITPSYSGMPSGGSENRTTENVALRCLPADEQKIVDAVRDAIRITRKYSNGSTRIRAFELIYWHNNTSIAAARKVNVNKTTLDLWNIAFVQLVDAFLTR